jgi:hypothetical protein
MNLLGGRHGGAADTPQCIGARAQRWPCLGGAPVAGFGVADDA